MELRISVNDLTKTRCITKIVDSFEKSGINFSTKEFGYLWVFPSSTAQILKNIFVILCQSRFQFLMWRNRRVDSLCYVPVKRFCDLETVQLFLELLQDIHCSTAKFKKAQQYDQQCSLTNSKFACEISFTSFMSKKLFNPFVAKVKKSVQVQKVYICAYYARVHIFEENRL